ncbi:MAG: hypothetical protein SXU28_06915 [Pseudomonadota bacterium]|nr:hypothetical protein [Pseudomonadota bacterium]
MRRSLIVKPIAAPRRSLALLALLTLPQPAFAQDSAQSRAPDDPAEMQDGASSSESSKRSIISSWSNEKQAAYKMWPAEAKRYYWTLTPERQKLFWGLADSDKVTLSGMSEADKAAVWERIEAKSDPSKSSE